MWNLKPEIDRFNAAVDNARRVSADVERFCAAQRRLTQIGVAPQAGGNARAWGPLVAAGLSTRPDGRRSGVDR